MGEKEQISTSHIDAMKDRYRAACEGSRPLKERWAMVTGAENQGSIGDTIVDMLSGCYGKVFAPAKADVDVQDPDEVDEYMKDFGPHDTLICCHGINKMAWFEDMSIDDISNIIDVNLIASALVARAYVRNTINNPWRKQIVFIGSMAYNHVLNASAPYCASKAGLAMLTRCLAWELAPKGYDVICVHPSNTEGAPMTEATIQGIMEYRNVDRETAERYWGAVLPRYRWLQPGDIAEFIFHFVNDPSGYLSGANIELGGGQR